MVGIGIIRYVIISFVAVFLKVYSTQGLAIYFSYVVALSHTENYRKKLFWESREKFAYHIYEECWKSHGNFKISLVTIQPIAPPLFYEHSHSFFNILYPCYPQSLVTATSLGRLFINPKFCQCPLRRGAHLWKILHETCFINMLCATYLQPSVH